MWYGYSNDIIAYDRARDVGVIMVSNDLRYQGNRTRIDDLIRRYDPTHIVLGFNNRGNWDETLRKFVSNTARNSSHDNIEDMCDRKAEYKKLMPNAKIISASFQTHGCRADFYHCSPEKFPKCIALL